MKAHSDPANKGNALSAFGGVLTPDGVSATDASTVVFKLQAANGNFPYLVSSDNYNVIILPKSFDYGGDYTKSFTGTGPWKLLNKQADLGNDSPFAPVFPSTDTSVPQRAQDLAQAQQLMATAGATNGFDVTLYTWNGFEIPDLAQLIQQAATQIKINIKLQVDDANTYYSKYWLDSPLGITDYGHRGVPNVFLGAPLLSTGTWNAA